MDTEKYEALLTAVRLGSLTQAARELGYTQSGLTHMMNALETECGVPLLQRGHAGVTLTSQGQALLPRIEGLLDAAQALEREQAQLRGGRETLVRVGAYTSICMHWLPAILRRFRDEHPHIRVEIRDVGGIDSLIRVLEAGEIDLAIGSWNPEIRCDWIPLRDDPLVAVLPADLDWAGDTFPLEEYQGRRFLMPTNGFDKDILRALGDIRPEVLGNQVEDNVVLSMVEHGLGVSMLSRLVVTGARQTVRVLPLSPHASRQLGIALLSVRTAAPAVRRFVACTRKYVPAIGE